VRDMRARGRDVSHIRHVVDLALDGDPEARHDIRESGRRLGEVLAAGVNLLNPAAIVVGGDMAPPTTPLWPDCAKPLWQCQRHRTRICRSCPPPTPTSQG